MWQAHNQTDMELNKKEKRIQAKSKLNQTKPTKIVA